MANACIGCGVCCASYRIAFHWSETTACETGTVPVELTETLRLHEVAMKGTSSNTPYCIALAGTPGVDAACSIHGQHPSCCREVALGSDQCTRARVRHGLPPLDTRAIASAYGDPNPPATPLTNERPQNNADDDRPTHRPTMTLWAAVTPPPEAESNVNAGAN